MLAHSPVKLKSGETELATGEHHMHYKYLVVHPLLIYDFTLQKNNYSKQN